MVTHRLVASEALVGGGAYFAARILGRPDLVSFRTFESRAVHPRVFDGQSAGIARHHGTEVEAVGRQVRVPTAARGVELPCHVAPTACVRITRRICKIGKFQFNGVRNSLVQGKITNNNALCMGALEEGGTHNYVTLVVYSLEQVGQHCSGLVGAIGLAQWRGGHTTTSHFSLPRMQWHMRHGSLV